MQKKIAVFLLCVMCAMTACGRTEEVEIQDASKVQQSFAESSEAAKEMAGLSSEALDEEGKEVAETSAEIMDVTKGVKTTEEARAPEPEERNGDPGLEHKDEETTSEPEPKEETIPKPEHNEEVAYEPEIKDETSSESEVKEDTTVPSHTSCTWDGGSVTTVPTCSSTGINTYTCTVCGAVRTESIPGVSHNYVTETMAATCTEAGKTKTYCSMCGNVQEETVNGDATGHDFQKDYWPSAPTCTSGGSYSMICSRCGTVGEHGRDGILPHTPVTVEEKHGNCISPSILVTTCSSCGFEISRDGRLEDEHDWVTGTYEDFNLETLVWETKTSTQCSRCGKMQ